jgi:hypothetical protein
MSIKEAQVLIAVAQKQIQHTLHTLEQETGLAVHSVPIQHEKGQVQVQLKVQLP